MIYGFSWLTLTNGFVEWRPKKVVPSFEAYLLSKTLLLLLFVLVMF